MQKIQKVINICSKLSAIHCAVSDSSSFFTKIMLDPPRTGASEMMSTISKLKPEKIVYVSCNPATLARDAKILGANGYKLKSAGVMDMFPHTSHIESIAEFVPE